MNKSKVISNITETINKTPYIRELYDKTDISRIADIVIATGNIESTEEAIEIYDEYNPAGWEYSEIEIKKNKAVIYYKGTKAISFGFTLENNEEETKVVIDEVEGNTDFLELFFDEIIEAVSI